MDISAALDDVASCQGFFVITVGGDDTDWLPIQRCYDHGYTDLIEATARRYGNTDPLVATSLVHLAHATRLWSPMLACALMHKVVPDLRRLQRAVDGTALRLPTATGHPLEGSAADQLYRIVVQEHLEQFAAGLAVRPANGLLAGNIASALVGACQALSATHPELSNEIAVTCDVLLATGILAGSGQLGGPHRQLRRRSCCLFYRTSAGSVCTDCVFTQPPSRSHRPG